MTDHQDFALWLAREKRMLADAGYQETQSAFAALKARLGVGLVLSVMFAAVSLVGAFSQREYSPICAFLALGFGVAGGLCAVGLYSSTLISKNFGPERVDGILSDVPQRDEEHASLWLAYTVSFITAENGRTLARHTRWFRAACVALALTPLLASVLAVACGVWVAL